MNILPVKNPPPPGTRPHDCNGLCRPPRHLEVVWIHPGVDPPTWPDDAFENTLRLWVGVKSARLIGRAELPVREEDGWIAWTTEFIW